MDKTFCTSLFCRLLRFQHHLPAQGFPPLLMVVSDDQQVQEFRLHTEICDVLSRILLRF